MQDFEQRNKAIHVFSKVSIITIDNELWLDFANRGLNVFNLIPNALQMKENLDDTGALKRTSPFPYYVR